MGSITDIRYVLTQRALTIFCETYHILDEVNPQLPSPNQTIHEMPSGKIGVYTSKGVPKDPFPKSSEFNAKHFATLVALPAPLHKYPEPFLCLVGINRYYTLDEDAYPKFLGDNDQEMDLLSFIRTADPTKVRVAERQRVENETRLLESTIERVVLLLSIAPARASSELEASVDKFFDEGASGDRQGTDIQPVAVTTDTIMEDVASLQQRSQRKKTAVADAGGPSHPPKKLREDYGALGVASTAGKSMSAVQSLFTGDVLNAEARGEPIPTFPFVTSSVSATPECEDKSLADSVTRLNLRTIGAPQRSSAPTIATVTTVTAAIDADAMAARAPVTPFLFGVGSSSTGRTDSVPGGFSNVSGSDFLIVGIRTVVDPDSDLQKVYVPRWSATNGFGLDDSQKRKLRAVDDEHAELLKVKDGEIESLKAQLLLKEAESTEAIRLRAEVFKFEAAEQSLRGEVGVLRDQSAALEREKNELSVKVTDLSASVKVREQEVADLDAQVTAVKLQNDNLADQVHGLEISFARLQEKVAAYEDFIGQLEKFQDKKLEEVNEKFYKLWAAISKAVEKGMQEGLSAGIIHGAERRKLADVAAYNPSTKADYLSALQRLQNVNFSLIAELKSDKDASLMVSIHHSPDQRVVGASALSLSSEVSHSRVKKMRENIAKHVSALRGVFVSLSKPLSAAALEGMKGTSGSTHDTTTTLSTTFVFVSTIPPISTDDYEVAHADGQEGTSVDDETATVDNINLFSDVSNAELNILERSFAFLGLLCSHMYLHHLEAFSAVISTL
nr:hypothetical protein [Tanacetum cinerariifolium]